MKTTDYNHPFVRKILPLLMSCELTYPETAQLRPTASALLDLAMVCAAQRSRYGGKPLCSEAMLECADARHESAATLSMLMAEAAAALLQCDDAELAAYGLRLEERSFWGLADAIGRAMM